MNKVAFVFPGQGAQFVGMGKTLAQNDAKAREVFERADSELGFSLSTLCFAGPDAALRATSNTQPAVLVHSVALYRALDVQPDVVAGHSLGEYTAHVAAGSFSLETAVKLVRARGELMERSIAGEPGGMSAVSDWPADAVEAACRADGSDVEVANYNSHAQVVIAGRSAALSRVGALLAKEGARVTPLPVSAPFHTRFMQPAEQELAQVLARVELSASTCPVYTNVDAAPCQTASYTRDSLERQVSRPVRWKACVERMQRDGVSLVVEIGPRSVLAAMVSACAPSIQVLRVLQSKDFPAAREAVAEVRRARARLRAATA